jgi:DNA helicase-2/ATP-dependent DNA helicase PcrA
MILNSLNKAQQQAVSAPLGHQLILAGAGSGKTRVLIHRMAWLMEVEKIPAFNMLAVTFTNKAAHEMRTRIEAQLNFSAKTMWIGTFHGLSHRFLRHHWQEANLPQAFQILDSDDQLRLIRRTIQALNLDEDRFPPKEAQWFINSQKEEGKEPHQVDAHHVSHPLFIKIYQAYQTACQTAQAIDFADLLLKTTQVLQTNQALREHYQERFRCILVDEFQDTNTIQYAWLKLFAGKKSAVMVVGDDDQSIYGWRGAKIKNIKDFQLHFEATIVRLEQNYRSTGVILKAANALISKNTGRLGKNLWTEGEDGDLITVYAGFTDEDETFFIRDRIQSLRREYALKDMAILYRSNAQSRLIEEKLMQLGIPYRVYGGLRYFDRAEIKDALAYLRIIANPSDDTALERIINMPPRGIGDRTMMSIRDHAKLMQISLWQALIELQAQSYFPARAALALSQFVMLIQELSQRSRDLILPEQVELILQKSDLFTHHSKEKGEKGLARVENLEELINAAQQFMQEHLTEDISPLTAFLSYAMLESGEEQAGAYEDCVQLMTLHSAKGLEFPIVFLSGCEDELFPHYLSMHDPLKLEEERRLCYVGMTRAKEKLFMTYAERRRMHGKEVYHRASRFLHEIPSELINEIRFRTKVTRAVSAERNDSSISYQPASAGKFSVGQKVQHHIFGSGVVLDCDGDGDHMKVKVKFSQAGTKILMASFLAEKK